MSSSQVPSLEKAKRLAELQARIASKIDLSKSHLPLRTLSSAAASFPSASIKPQPGNADRKDLNKRPNPYLASEPPPNSSVAMEKSHHRGKAFKFIQKGKYISEANKMRKLVGHPDG